jgi:hypothetical protein
MGERLLIFLSRVANVATGGDWELFCTRIVRNRWHRTGRVVDALWYAATGENKHTRRSYCWDRLYNRRPR